MFNMDNNYVAAHRATKITISSLRALISDCEGSIIEASAFLNDGTRSENPDVSILSWTEYP